MTTACPLIVVEKSHSPTDWDRHAGIEVTMAKTDSNP